LVVAEVLVWAVAVEQCMGKHAIRFGVEAEAVTLLLQALVNLRLPVTVEMARLVLHLLAVAVLLTLPTQTLSTVALAV
jgi:hypothetical protein